METMVIYQKTITKKDGGTFQKWFVQLEEGVTIEAQLTENCRNQLIKDDLKSPVQIEVVEGDYFFKRKPYTNNKGENKTKYVFVLKGYQKGTQSTFKGYSVNDVVSDIKKSREEAVSIDDIIE